jgi:hypothetical protein
VFFMLIVIPRWLPLQDIVFTWDQLVLFITRWTIQALESLWLGKSVVIYTNVDFLFSFIYIFYRDQYNDVLTRQWVDIFNEIFSEDNYTPIHVENVEEYTSVIIQFPIQDENLERVRYWLSCITSFMIW